MTSASRWRTWRDKAEARAAKLARDKERIKNFSPERKEEHLARRRARWAVNTANGLYHKHKYLLELARHIYRENGGDLDEIRRAVGVQEWGGAGPTLITRNMRLMTMAYDAFRLNVLAYANGFTQWHYRTEDTVEEVARHGYFSGSDMVRRGDHILANCSNGNIALFAAL